MNASERRAWIALASINGVGPEIFAELLATFGTASDVMRRAAAGDVHRWAARRRRDTGRPVTSGQTLDDLAHLSATADGRLALLDELGLWSLTPLDADYPTRLRDLDPPPPAIHGLGNRALLAAQRMVAIVGTRRPTPAGRHLAAQAATRLVEAGAVVVSGVAVGIDGAAHAATLAASGLTVGVIGGGHEHPGPQAHAGLRREIAHRGALVSEHYPTVEPTHGTYPRRNRIIAALAEATLVIEAPARSGALITARRAMELDRPVLVAPGRVGDWSTAGALGLLRETPARPLVGLDEMLADLGYLDEPVGDTPPAVTGQVSGPRVTSVAAALAMLGAAERAVAERISRSPAGLDVLVDETGLAPQVVSGAVTLLLLRGWVQPVGPAYLPAGPLLGRA